jgi:hypothetical protein
VLLAGGAASAIVYFAMDVIAALFHDGYNYRDQTISELSAIGAPTRPFWEVSGFFFSALVIAGAAGIWLSAGARRSLRAVALLVGVIGVLAMFAWPFAPMHQREVLATGGGTAQDTAHIALGSIDSILYLTAIIIGSGALGKRFRRYSWATLAVVFIAGAYTGIQSPKVADDGSTPVLGISERVALFASMAWVSSLSAALLLRWADRSTRTPPTPGLGPNLRKPR